MAKGSEQFAWRLYPGVPHVCWSCERKLLVKDVAEVRTRYTYSSPSSLAVHKTEFLCVACRSETIKALTRP